MTAQNSLNLLCIGEAMAELRRTDTGSFDVSFAGDSFNTAVYASRILGDNKVGFCSVIGQDPLSSGLLTLAKEEGLNIDYLQHHPSRNIGVYAVATDERGERSFYYWRDQSAARTLLTHADETKYIPKAQVIYFSAISLAVMDKAARALLFQTLTQRQNEGCLIAFDSNFRPKLWEDIPTAQHMISKAWEMADIALPSIDDEMALFDETAEQVIARFTAQKWHSIAIKRGDKGPLSPHLPTAQHPPFSVAEKVVDTTAAGDSFNAGFLASLTTGQPLPQCLTTAHRLACKAIGVRGALIPKSQA